MHDAVNIGALLTQATERLRAVSDSARLDAELLLARAIDMPRSFLFAHAEDELDDAAIARFTTTLERRLDGEPMAYIDGSKEFWSLTLAVSPATLVPRPETELLVEQAINRLPRRGAARVLDLGTGSGAVALAIASARPLCEVVATDISDEALAVARLNARQLMITNVTFLRGDWTAPVRGRQFDLVVSNPPYVASDDPALRALAHEPRSALVAGSDGLDAIRRIAAEVVDIVRPEGVLIVEHGETQQHAVGEILQSAGWCNVSCVNDLSGRPRASIAEAIQGPLPYAPD